MLCAFYTPFCSPAFGAIVPFKNKSSVFKKAAVISMSKHASEVGVDVLKNGGNAMDAVMAMQLVLTAVEPYASGIGGGGFLLYYDAKKEKLFGYNGRETSPRSVRNIGKIKKIHQKLPSGGSHGYEHDIALIGVPGILKMLDLAHKRHGKMSWFDVFNLPILFLEKGFFPGQKFMFFYNKLNARLKLDAVYQFSLDGLVHNKDLLSTFRYLQSSGSSDTFYKGLFNKRVIMPVLNDVGSDLSRRDFVLYSAFEEVPLCADYAGLKICTRNKHSAPLVALKLLEGGLRVSNVYDDDVYNINLISEAINKAVKFRGKNKETNDIGLILEKVINDSNFQLYPRGDFDLQKLADKMGEETIGDKSINGTTNMIVIDEMGNIAVLSSSINGYFGSGVVVGGFFLNNTLIAFSKTGVHAPKSNARPISAMSPILVFNSKAMPIMGIGSAGGIRIISYVVSSLALMLSEGIDPQVAIDALKYAVYGRDDGSFNFEDVPQAFNASLMLEERYGKKTLLSPLVVSGTSAFKLKNGSILCGVETRRGGYAAGY